MDKDHKKFKLEYIDENLKFKSTIEEYYTLKYH